jgi:hypothetical protein
MADEERDSKSTRHPAVVSLGSTDAGKVGGRLSVTLDDDGN